MLRKPPLLPLTRWLRKPNNLTTFAEWRAHPCVARHSVAFFRLGATRDTVPE